MSPLLALWLAASPFPALATDPKPPSSEDLERLMRPLNRIREIRDGRLKPSQAQRLEIEKRVGLRDEEGRSLRPRNPNRDYFEVTHRESERLAEIQESFHKSVAEAFAQLSANERARYATATTDYNKALIEIRPLAEEAIRVAIEAYGIPERTGAIANGPPLPTGPDDVPSFRGKVVRFSPAFDASLEESRFGVTTDDGRVEIGLSAFAYPGRLGATLFHEGLHIADLLDPAVDLRNAPATEARIRRSIRPLLERVFALRAEDVQKHDEKRQREEALAEKWRLLIAGGFSPWKKSHRPAFPLDALPARPYDADELGGILERASTEAEYEQDPADPLPAESREPYEAAGEYAADLDAHEARENEDRLAAEAAQAAFLASRDPQWEALRDWTRAACEYLEPVELVPTGAGGDNPHFEHMKWALAENERRIMAKGESDAGARKYLLAHFVVLPEARIKSLLRGHKSELDRCERGVIRMILKAPGPISAGWLVSQLDYRKGGGRIGGVLRTIAKALKKSSAAIVDGIQAPFIAVRSAAAAKHADPAASGKSGGGGNRDAVETERDPPEAYQPERRKIWQGSPTFERLKGIAEGSIGF